MTLQHSLTAAAAGLALPVVVMAVLAYSQGPVQASDRVALPVPCTALSTQHSCAHTAAHAFVVGEVAAPEQLHLVKRPGAYGLSIPPKGHVYGILQGQLIRIDEDDRRILSVLRRVDRIPD